MAPSQEGPDEYTRLWSEVKQTRLYSIMMHELGHTIRLDHLNDSGYIMFASQPLPLDISQDEIRAVQLMTALPNGTELGDYDLFAPR